VGDAHRSTVDPTPPPQSIQAQIVKTFGSGSIMLDVAKCESGFRQFDKNGNVLRGRENNNDIGLFQINTTYHLEQSQKMGIDIFTLKGNIQYAKYLYVSSGTTPWNWSKHCWGK